MPQVRNYRAWLIGGASVLMLAPSTVQAQEGEPEEEARSLDTIVVTAQFTEQTAQTTPLSITALGADALENMGIQEMEDLGVAVPNLTIKPSGSLYGPGVQVFIRGIGQRDTTMALEPGVGMYVDDVYYATLLGSAFDLIDIERVEVLRGPQGTLAGKNSIGGAIRVFSKSPTGDGSGYASLTYGSYDRVDFKGGMDVQLADNLFARVSGISKSRDGWFERIDYGCENPGMGVPTYSINTNCVLGTEGGMDVAGGRIALRWLPSDTLEVNISADLTDDNSETQPQQLLGTENPLLTGLPGVDFTTELGDDYSYGNFVDPGVRADGPTGTAASVPAISHIQTSGVSAIIDWDITPNMYLKSITAYREVDAENGHDFDSSPFDVTLAFTNTDIIQKTQEIRLGGLVFDDRLEWTVGGFYYEGLGHKGGPTWSLPTTTFASIITGTDEIITESKSVFAHAIFNITDKLQVLGGIRYTDEYKSYEFQRRDPENPSQPAVIGGAGPLDGVIGVAEGETTDYRLGLNYQLTDDVMVYGQYSTGYKGGGVNARPFNPSQLLPFDPETVDAYEVGFKSDLFDGTLRLNASAFFNDYENIVVTIRRPPPRQVPTNAGAAEIKGIELETTWIPTDNFQLDANMSWLDFQYTELTDLAIESGLPISAIQPFTPELKWNIGAEYRFDLQGGSSVTPRLDASYQGDMYSQPENDPRDYVEAYTLLNGRITWRNAKGDLSVSVSGTNLLDEDYFLNRHFFSSPLGISLGQPGRPREWAITVAKQFN